MYVTLVYAWYSAAPTSRSRLPPTVQGASSFPTISSPGQLCTHRELAVSSPVAKGRANPTDCTEIMRARPYATCLANNGIVMVAFVKLSLINTAKCRDGNHHALASCRIPPFVKTSHHPSCAAPASLSVNRSPVLSCPPSIYLIVQVFVQPLQCVYRYPGLGSLHLSPCGSSPRSPIPSYTCSAPQPASASLSKPDCQPIKLQTRGDTSEPLSRPTSYSPAAQYSARIRERYTRYR